MPGFRHLWALCFLVVQFDVLRAQSYNITLESTAPQIVWSPALCNTSLVDVNCSSAWRLSDDVPGIEVMSTNGPDPDAGDIIPQMFLSFQGSAIYIRTSPLSIALANITLSSMSQRPLYVDAQVNTSIGWIAADGLPDDRIITLGITYVPDTGGQNGDGGRLDIEFMTLTVASASVTSAFLPSVTLPATSTPPIFTQSSTPASTSSAHKQSKGAIIGESLGPALGVILMSAGIAVVIRRRKITKEASEQEWGDYERGIQKARDKDSSRWF